MSSAIPSTYRTQHSFDDFDQLAAEAKAWDLQFDQLDRGAFRGELLQFAVRSVQVGECRFDRAIYQRGAPPTGTRTFAVPAEDGTQFVWRGNRIDGNQLLVFPRDEFTGVSHPGFHVFTCSIAEELLDKVGESLGCDQLLKDAGDDGVVECTPAALERLRKCLRGMCDRAAGESPFNGDGRLISTMTEELPHRIMSAIVASPGSRAKRASQRRQRAIIKAEAYIDRHVSEPIAVPDLCRAAQVSLRTLEYAFAERYQLTPKAFITTHRLNGVRRQLRNTKLPNQKIVDVANGWGFWHMGQFAADYRRQFGELPSETLQRSRD